MEMEHGRGQQDRCTRLDRIVEVCEFARAARGHDRRRHRLGHRPDHRQVVARLGAIATPVVRV